KYEHTKEDQWKYDITDSEGNRQLGGEDFVDVNIIEKSDDCDATCEELKEKTMEVRVVSNLLSMFPNDTQENDCATSYEDLKSSHGDSDDEDPKRYTVFTLTRHLENPKFKFMLNMIFGNSKEFKRAIELHIVLQKKTSSLRTKVQVQMQFVRC
ncbi:hypothetical protein H5410_051899, partial [Solanum commersonii]